jgi:hypothetical protein
VLSKIACIIHEMGKRNEIQAKTDLYVKDGEISIN